MQVLSIPKVVAEIGCNHRGEIDTAKQLIVVAKACNADVAKFQKRNPKELLTPEQYDAPYENPHSYGRTYGEHREFLEFPIGVHEKLKRYAEEHSIEYSTSVWDLTSAREIVKLNPSYIKVPSACNNHLEMLKVLRDEFAGGIHISVGMTYPEEEEKLVKFFEGVADRLVLYACTSGYPVPFKNVCLLEIERLIRTYKEKGRCSAVGFSGHHLGIAVDLGATVLGAEWIERHFTLDRTWKGTDHAASLEPDGLRKLKRDLHNLGEAWRYKEGGILDIEKVQREKLRFRGAVRLEPSLGDYSD